MTHHFTYLDWIIGGFQFAAETQKLVLAVALGITLLLLASVARKKIGSGNLKDNIIPSQRLGLTAIIDFFVEKFVAYHDSILGKENRRFVAFTGSTFLFIFLSNLLGLVPGMPAITTTIWVNVGMALCVFVYFNYFGIKTHGVKNYFKHFCGPGGLVVIILLPVELFSTCLRVLTLNLRLYWNISADHLVLGIMTDLTMLIVPVIFYGLGTFVAFMQAFVFTTLTMIYLAQVTQHAEGH